MEIELSNEREMEDRFVALLRDQPSATQVFGEPLSLVGRQVPVARTQLGDDYPVRSRRLDVACVDDDGRIIVCELKTVLDEKLLLQGLAYARLVQRNLPAWEEALDRTLDSRVRLWLFNWGLHDTWLDLMRPLRSAYEPWLAELRYYGAWVDSEKPHIQLRRLDDMTRPQAIGEGFGTEALLATAEEISDSLSDGDEAA